MFPGLAWTGIFLTFLAPILALLTLASESRIQENRPVVDRDSSTPLKARG
jgi:hypothetical protein